MSHEEFLTWLLTEACNPSTEVRKKALSTLLENMGDRKTVGSHTFSAELYNQLNDLFQNGRKKINMIKIVRTETGLMLKEAKDFVEKHWDFS